jgi:hypothetical protein
VTFSQKSAVKKHLAQGIKKTHYLTPDALNNPAEKVDQEPAAATDGTPTLVDDKEPIVVSKRP